MFAYKLSVLCIFIMKHELLDSRLNIDIFSFLAYFFMTFGM